MTIEWMDPPVAEDFWCEQCWDVHSKAETYKKRIWYTLFLGYRRCCLWCGGEVTPSTEVTFT